MLYSNALAPIDFSLAGNLTDSNPFSEVKSYFPTVTSASGIANAASPIAVISTPDGDSFGRTKLWFPPFLFAIPLAVRPVIVAPSALYVKSSLVQPLPTKLSYLITYVRSALLGRLL